VVLTPVTEASSRQQQEVHSWPQQGRVQSYGREGCAGHGEIREEEIKDDFGFFIKSLMLARQITI